MSTLREMLVNERISLSNRVAAIDTLLGEIDEPRPAAAPARTPRRGRKKMSVAARKAVSERMKKMWAARRAANKKAPAARKG